MYTLGSIMTNDSCPGRQLISQNAEVFGLLESS